MGNKKKPSKQTKKNKVKNPEKNPEKLIIKQKYIIN